MACGCVRARACVCACVWVRAWHAVRACVYAHTCMTSVYLLFPRREQSSEWVCRGSDTQTANRKSSFSKRCCTLVPRNSWLCVRIPPAILSARRYSRSLGCLQGGEKKTSNNISMRSRYFLSFKKKITFKKNRWWMKCRLFAHTKVDERIVFDVCEGRREQKDVVPVHTYKLPYAQKKPPSCGKPH